MTLTVATNAADDDSRAVRERLSADRAASRLFAQDASLWGPEAADEADRRLGWVNFADRARELIGEVEALRAELAADGIDRIVLCGMGGSSLAPEIIAQWAGVPLTVLDSTHPARVRRAVHCDLARTVVVVSSKSGSTVDTLSHKAAFEHAFAEAGLNIARHMIIVTDPGTELGEDAAARGMRVFTADPRVGGRYSALTAFGLVPAGLAGADIARLVDEAVSVHTELAIDSVENPAIHLAGLLMQALPERYVLAVHPTRDAAWGLGVWVEQLIAESTGKIGRGMLPIALERGAPELSRPLSSTALGVSIGVESSREGPTPGEVEVSGPLGSQLLLWETATALLGRLLDVNPFDQPDVESAKVAAREILRTRTVSAPAQSALTDVPGAEVLDAPSADLIRAADVISALRNLATTPHFLSIQAYLDGDSGLEEPLARLRDRLAETLGVPVSLDWGPRFLHSTGQFHKGGPALGVFLQLLDTADPEFYIADSTDGFGELITAQAHGDREVLTSRGLPVIAVRASDPHRLVAALLDAMSATNPAND